MQNSRPIWFASSAQYVRVCERNERILKRASRVAALLECYGLFDQLKVFAPRPAAREETLCFHGSEYLNFLAKASASDDPERCEIEGRRFGLGFDCPVSASVYEYATLIAGGTLSCVRALEKGLTPIAINPNGGWHHARSNSAAGYCYINDCVLGIMRLQRNFRRIFYLDLDAHHGDAVQEAFCSTQSVLTVSCHEYEPGFFPGTGSLQETGVGSGRYHLINIPFRDGLNDIQFIDVVDRLLPAIRSCFKPQAVVIQCGMDGLSQDPVSIFNLTPASYVHTVLLIQGWQIPCLLLGGGGYHPINVAKCWTKVISELVKKKISTDIPDHEYYMDYSPDFTLDIAPSHIPNQNSEEYLSSIVAFVLQRLQHIEVVATT